MTKKAISDQTGKINQSIEALHQAERVAVLTKAGGSAESGVPAFRGADGLWRQYRATDLATSEAFVSVTRPQAPASLGRSGLHGRRPSSQLPWR
jgi:Sir2 family